jgi:hypothetical protein
VFTALLESVTNKQEPRTYTHVLGRPAWQTLLLPSEILSKSPEVLVPYLTHILYLFPLGSCVVDFARFIGEHDGPDGVATEAESCAAKDDDGYGRAGG